MSRENEILESKLPFSYPKLANGRPEHLAVIVSAMREYAREMSIGFARFLGDHCIQYIDHAEVWTYIKDGKDYNLTELYTKYPETLNKKV